MAYKVKTLKPCRICGQLTNRRRNGKRDPQCLDCGITAAIENCYATAEFVVESQTKAMERFLEWVDSGGIEKANLSPGWVRSQYEVAERYRQMLNQPPSPNVSVGSP